MEYLILAALTTSNVTIMCDQTEPLQLGFGDSRIIRSPGYPFQYPQTHDCRLSMETTDGSYLQVRVELSTSCCAGSYLCYAQKPNPFVEDII